ncbi:MAG: AraC family ligand binding domain-containing protein [Phycisphaerae bacterium]|nr:AraC family ligand binding domain-containing protein [Phycisphaerae bacterium]MDZ4781018.1 AraC family ligand binding domain-containing protein [Planctomycetia bacterium]
MSDTARFADLRVFEARDNEYWPSIIIPRLQIEREIGRLADLPVDAAKGRESLVVHPLSKEPGLGLAPGIDVLLSVLRPGESSVPRRHNAGQLSISITGAGLSEINGKRIRFEKWDVWTTPSMAVYRVTNDTKDLLAYFTYSNRPMLCKLEIYHAETGVAMPDVEVLPIPPPAERAKSRAPIKAITPDGAHLMSYEHLVDPDYVANRPLHWSFKTVRQELEDVKRIGDGYTGRRLYVLYNPATEARNGTTHSFFASIAAYPPDMVDEPHRHSSAAINYYLSGNGKSVVLGKKFQWEGGDLMLSAPGWAVHGHGSRNQGFYALTVQDHPLQIAMESLIWQENMRGPIRNLGAELGFQTNLKDVVGAT